jgi:hypothetical protein
MNIETLWYNILDRDLTILQRIIGGI